MDKKVEFRVRDVLLSSGEFTKEAVILTEDGKEIYESAPSGLTKGFKENEEAKESDTGNLKRLYKLESINLSQKDFDSFISSKFGTRISTPLSLAYLKYLSYKKGFKEEELYEFISFLYNKKSGTPRIICNILNGGKHAGNDLDFCEFMIIPNGENISENIRIASEVYLDLKSLIESKLGKKNTMVGREGGFSPDISEVEFALHLLQSSINIRNKDKCFIGIDISANSFSEKRGSKFIYKIRGKQYDTEALFRYYIGLTKKFPEIIYLEDLFHEEDIGGWVKMTAYFKNKLMVVADDLTVSNRNYLRKFRKCFNTCILKVNQVGDVSRFVESYNFCKRNGIKTIISQRSGETDSPILSHLATGLGSDFIKAGAPARERIVKYNELIRLSVRLNCKKYKPAKEK